MFCMLPVPTGNKGKKVVVAGASGSKTWLHSHSYSVGYSHLLGPQFRVLHLAYAQSYQKTWSQNKKVKNTLIKERIRQIWANRIMAELYKLFANHPDRWHFIAVIFSQSTLKNKKK